MIAALVLFLALQVTSELRQHVDADYEKAEVEFGTEVGLAPGSAAAAYKLGVVLLNRGRVSEAISELRRANTLQPDMPETLLELGKALNGSGDASSAEP